MFPAPRSALSCGSAKSSTLMSRERSRAGKANTTSPVHSFRPALGVPSAVAISISSSLWDYASSSS
jgi:hypothetical protein